MAGVTSMPMPSPSMKGMIGSSGTVREKSGLMRILPPAAGTAMCSYCMWTAPSLLGLGVGCGRRALVGAALLALLGDQHGKLERLLMVQARVDARAVGARQILVGEAAGAPGAFGDIIAGELDVYPAQVRAHVSMDAEREIELLQDVLEAARLEAPGGGLGVAVHGVAYPQHRLPGLAHRLDRLRQRARDLLGAGALDESEAPGLVLRIERRDQPLQPRRIHG